MITPRKLKRMFERDKNLNSALRKEAGTTVNTEEIIEWSYLGELYRVARRYLVLLEPGYELANANARRRMETHGYCRNLPGLAKALGYRVVEHKLFPYSANPLNPTALTIIEKRPQTAVRAGTVLVCPRFKARLQRAGGMLFSPEALTVYPIIGGIPCLRLENGVVASRYVEFCNEEKQS
jgi:uncharacterized protein YbaR (Trm112 family)